MTVKILGPGCSKCRKLEKKVRELVNKHQINAEVIKIEDLNEMLNLGIMMTPALVINEKLLCCGNIPKEEQILKWLNDELQ